MVSLRNGALVTINLAKNLENPIGKSHGMNYTRLKFTFYNFVINHSQIAANPFLYDYVAPDCWFTRLWRIKDTRMSSYTSIEADRQDVKASFRFQLFFTPKINTLFLFGNPQYRKA